MARVLAAGETVSNFVESSIRTNIERRRTRAEFIARGLVSLAQAEHTSTWLNFRVDFTTEARENLQRLYEHLLERATTVEELHHAVRATDEIALAAESLIAFQPVSPASHVNALHRTWRCTTQELCVLKFSAHSVVGGEKRNVVFNAEHRH